MDIGVERRRQEPRLRALHTKMVSAREEGRKERRKKGRRGRGREKEKSLVASPAKKRLRLRVGGGELPGPKVESDCYRRRHLFGGDGRLLEDLEGVKRDVVFLACRIWEPSDVAAAVS